jgi:hypothetical protein
MLAARKNLPLAMTIPLAAEIVSGRAGMRSVPLGKTTKMPGYSWGISAWACRRGSELADNLAAVCAHCYARLGRYATPVVAAAHERRLAAVSDPRWVDAMVLLLRAWAAGSYFRWFDSGDLQSVDMLDKIVAVCRRTPSTRHWLPTHEPGIVGQWLAANPDGFPANLCVRISADYVEDRVTTPTHGLPTATVHRHKGEPVPAASGRRGDSIECLAYRRGGVCGSCRACWEPRVRNVSFLLHGGMRKDKP